MTQIAEDFLSELKKHENDGTDSMDWAEWAGYEIEEQIVEKFSIEDWNFIKENYKNKSDNMKALIASQIHLRKIALANI